NAMDSKAMDLRKRASTSRNSAVRNAVVAIVIFFVAHFALLVGVTTPEKFYFDEVHYVPAARQMLEPVMPVPMLNPMHPPLAKQLIALSIRGFGDGPLGWRYPGVLFGALAIVAVIRLMQGWRTQFADSSRRDWYRPELWSEFRYTHFVGCFVAIPAAVYLATFVPLYGGSWADILEAQRRIFADNTTTAISGHT